MMVVVEMMVVMMVVMLVLKIGMRAKVMVYIQFENSPNPDATVMIGVRLGQGSAG